ncbi:MAG: dihydrolipoyl dehydrogenase [Candidatus Auribacterota bacterium]|jgi:dihydrolipoamide dehydrogenase|nr:dihydrolipoyl dehydrogenase [Candidatus Auribacterota bacterium]
METKYDYDAVVIGAGPGGYVAAIRLAQLGKKTAVIERDKLGGVCLNIGCIPSKALIHQAEIFRNGIKNFKEFGIDLNMERFDYAKVQKKSRIAADKLSKGIAYLLKKNSVEVIAGSAKITDPHTVSVNETTTVSAENIIIATGSSARSIPNFDIDEDTVLSSTGALLLEKLPKRLAVLGSGAIGSEFAHIMNSFGVEVHLVELLDRLVPLEDDDMSKTLFDSFKRRGINIYLSHKAESMEKHDSGIKLFLKDNTGRQVTLEADKILVAVGRAPNTGGIGLESVSIVPEKGFIPVSDYYRTSVESIYAIGDVIDSPMLAHVASKEGEIVAEHIAGKETEKRIDPHTIPSAVYCEPEIASFGYTERDAKSAGVKFEKAVFPLRGAGKTVAVEQSEGMVKILFDPSTKEILGAHIAGIHATELIHEALLAKKAELLPQDIATMIHAHPTVSEAVMEAFRTAEGWAVHA